VLPLEGVSLLPLITGEGALDERTLYWEHEGNRAVRQGPWKLVSRHPGNWELYDMEADRTETNDVAARHPDRVREMATLYEKWAARCGVEPWEKVRPPK
jgi:arylsulfatase